MLGIIIRPKKGGDEMEISNCVLDGFINFFKLLIPKFISHWFECRTALKGAEKENQLAREDKVYRLQEQIAYLSELYTNAMLLRPDYN